MGCVYFVLRISAIVLCVCFQLVCLLKFELDLSGLSMDRIYVIKAPISVKSTLGFFFELYLI